MGYFVDTLLSLYILYEGEFPIGSTTISLPMTQLIYSFLIMRIMGLCMDVKQTQAHSARKIGNGDNNLPEKS
jgi:hypothetical protein